MLKGNQKKELLYRWFECVYSMADTKQNASGSQVTFFFHLMKRAISSFLLENSVLLDGVLQSIEFSYLSVIRFLILYVSNNIYGSKTEA